MFIPSLPLVLAFLVAPLVLYVVLFLLARRPVRLALARWGKYQIGLALVVVAPFLFLWARGSVPEVSRVTQLVLAVYVTTGILLQTCRGVCLIRLSHLDYLNLVASGCKRLLLSFELKEGATNVVLFGKDRTETLPVRQLTRRVVWTRFPARTTHDKISLLAQWLGKTLPGPLPRVHIVLKKRS